MTTYEQHIEHLSNVLSTDTPNLKESQDYLYGKFRLQTLGLGAPPEMRYLHVNPGWPSTYVRAIEERLDVEGFRVSGDSDNVDDLWKWWQYNNLDEESSLGHSDSLTFGRSYITISAPGDDDDPETPIIRLEAPLHMYAELDPRTRKVTRAVRMYKTRMDSAIADKATLYLPDRTVYLQRNDGANSPWRLDGKEVVHDLGVVPVVPLSNLPSLSNRYGRSEISSDLRKLTDAGGRTLMNMQAASELLAVPLRVFFGVNKEDLVGTDGTVNDAYYGRIVALQNDQAKAFEFRAAELRNFTDEMSELAKQVASLTGMPPQYLSFSSDNPASAEAIVASEGRLVKACERKARIFGESWEQAMRIALRVMNKPVPDEYRRLETVWADPSTPTYAAKADAASKLFANGQGAVPREQTWIDMGYSATQREQMKGWLKEDNAAMTALAKITGVGNPPAAAPSSSSNSSAAKPTRTITRQPQT